MSSHEERIRMLAEHPEETISPTLAAEVLGGTPYLYNVAARDGRLTLPHLWRGRNLRIFKQPVLDILRGNEERKAQ